MPAPLAMADARSNLVYILQARASTPPASGGGLVSGRISSGATSTQVVVCPSILDVQYHPPGGRPGPGGTRGLVYGLSPASRRRLLRLLGRIDYMTYQVDACTLTYHFGYEPAPAQWHRHMHVFERVLARDWPGVLGGVWVLEFQDRGAPHFHCLLVWRGEPPPIQKIRRWVGDAWNAIAEPGDAVARMVGTSVDRLKVHDDGGVARAMQYLAKYTGKQQQKRRLDRETGERLPTGRMWAHFLTIPQDERKSIELDHAGASTFLRRLRRWGRHVRYISGFGKRYKGGIVFGDPSIWLQLLRGIPPAKQPDDEPPAIRGP